MVQHSILGNMQNNEIIRRDWSGFGECRITVAPLRTSNGSQAGSLADRVFSGLPRLLSLSGLGSLSFTVDPSWFLQENPPAAAPIVLQFLRVHRRALAEEWNARQRLNAALPATTSRTEIHAGNQHATKLTEVEAPIQVDLRECQESGTTQERGDTRGLPTWYTTILRS
jgi:hypothetical protein